VRITQGLRTVAQVFSFKDKKTLPGIFLDDANGRPSLVGFLNNDQFAVTSQEQQQGRGLLQTFSVSEGKQRKEIILPNFRPADGNIAVRKDGQQIAYVGRENRDGRGTVLEILDLGTGGRGRSIPIGNLGQGGAVMPEGIGFSPTNNRIAVVFERGNQRVVMGWLLSTGATLAIDEVFSFNQAFSRDSASAIDWMPDGSALFVKGQIILSGNDGVPLADVNQLRNAIGQRVLDRETIEIVVAVTEQQKKLALVTLNPEAIAKASGRPARAPPDSR
jgi:hypothetical protein